MISPTVYVRTKLLAFPFHHRSRPNSPDYVWRIIQNQSALEGKARCGQFWEGGSPESRDAGGGKLQFGAVRAIV